MLTTISGACGIGVPPFTLAHPNAVCVPKARLTLGRAPVWGITSGEGRVPIILIWVLAASFQVNHAWLAPVIASTGRFGSVPFGTVRAAAF